MKEKKNIPNGSKTIKKVIIKKNKLMFAFSILFSLITSVFSIATAIILMNLINIASNGTIQKLNNLLKICALYIVAFLIISWINKYFRHNFYQKAMNNLKEYYIQNVLRSNINRLNLDKTSKYISVISNDYSSIETNYLEAILTLIQSIFLFILGLVVMIVLNIPMFLCVLITSFFPIVVSIIFSPKVSKAELKVANKNEIFLANLKDILVGFPIIKSFQAETRLGKIFIQHSCELEGEKRNKRDTQVNLSILSEASGNCIVFAVFLFGVSQVINGDMPVGVVIAFIQLLNFIIVPIQNIPQAVAKLGSANKIMNKVGNIFDEKDKVDKSLHISCIKNGITLKDVTFSYDEKNALEHINLDLHMGKSYAIVGPSGSGKSTLVKLIQSYSETYEGSILFDDLELKYIDTQSIYTNLSVIQQDVFIFDDSIINNITMFKQFEQDKINEAIQKAGLIELIKEKGKDYKCGENGNKLSGGEKQRIAIARTFLLNSSILIMDEATAALDNENAMAIENAILSFDDKLRIIITHKLSSTCLSKYDEIIMLKEGRIIEQGKFDHLIREQGDFWCLYNFSKN